MSLDKFGSARIPFGSLMPLSHLNGEDAEDTALLIEMSDRAHDYLTSFSWCEAILDGYFAGGAGGVFGIFLFNVVPTRSEIDDWIWVMAGDVPSAYLPFEDAPSVSNVFDLYLEGMSRWVEWARSGRLQRPTNVPPLDAEPTAEMATSVEKKLKSLRQILGSLFAR